MDTITYETLKTAPEVISKIYQDGPKSIIINARGDAVAPFRTNILPKLIFIRDDGWTLGASLKLRDVAFELFASQWIAFIDLRKSDPRLFRPISEYKPQ